MDDHGSWMDRDITILYMFHLKIAHKTFPGNQPFVLCVVVKTCLDKRVELDLLVVGLYKVCQEIRPIELEAKMMTIVLNFDWTTHKPRTSRLSEDPLAG